MRVKSDGTAEQPPSFSLTCGGPFYRIERRLGLTRKGIPGIWIRAAVGVAVTFLPLVVLAAVEGVLFGSRVTLPLLSDWAVYTRFVFAIPLLLDAERSIDSRISSAVQHAQTSGLVEGKARADFEAALAKLERTRDSLFPEAFLVVAAFALAWFTSSAMLGLNVSSWKTITPGLETSTTLAGRWFELVSLPIFQFLVLLWLWRILLWSAFLARISRSDLRLVPAHPDGAAGTAFLGGTHTSFAALLVPLGAAAAAGGVQWVQYGGGTFEMLRNSLIAFVVIGLVVTLGPLLVFTPRLLTAKRRGLAEYGRVASDFTRRFDQKWLRRDRLGEENALSSSDIQSLVSLVNSYQLIRSMRIMPPSTRHLATLTLSAVIPMLPFLAIIMPLDELDILKQLAQLFVL